MNVEKYQINSKEDLDQFISKKWIEINYYLDKQMDNVTVPFYCSVDIRESKSKYAPIDNNFYPAGFNNICAQDLEESVPYFLKSIKSISPEAQNVAILTESNTKNLFYLDNLFYLGRCIENAGLNVKFISLDQNLFSNNESAIKLFSFSKFPIIIEKCNLNVNTFFLENSPDWNIDLVLLNHDQSKPIEISWEKINNPVVPTPLVGWYNRHKINHFEHYSRVVQSFSKEFSINPGLIQANFRSMRGIDFSSKDGLHLLAKEVDLLRNELQPEQNIFIKASKGTYGMGINVVKSGDDIINMNRKTRNKMDIGKNNIKFTDTIIQEGIETIIQYDNMPAEITIYLVGGKSIGGFMRVNSQKKASENLNSRGMVFRKFCISEIRQNQDYKMQEAVYTIIARLSALAGGHEIKEVM